MQTGTAGLMCVRNFQFLISAFNVRFGTNTEPNLQNALKFDLFFWMLHRNCFVQQSLRPTVLSQRPWLQVFLTDWNVREMIYVNPRFFRSCPSFGNFEKEIKEYRRVQTSSQRLERFKCLSSDLVAAALRV